jgi:hypothetical protein
MRQTSVTRRDAGRHPRCGRGDTLQRRCGARAMRRANKLGGTPSSLIASKRVSVRQRCARFPPAAPACTPRSRRVERGACLLASSCAAPPCRGRAGVLGPTQFRFPGHRRAMRRVRHVGPLPDAHTHVQGVAVGRSFGRLPWTTRTRRFDERDAGRSLLGGSLLCVSLHGRRWLLSCRDRRPLRFSAHSPYAAPTSNGAAAALTARPPDHQEKLMAAMDPSHDPESAT